MDSRVWKIIDPEGLSYLRKAGLEEENQFSSFFLAFRSLGSSILCEVYWKLRIHCALIGDFSLFGPTSNLLDEMRFSWSN